jgi:hypothetical protein
MIDDPILPRHAILPASCAQCNMVLMKGKRIITLYLQDGTNYSIKFSDEPSAILWRDALHAMALERKKRDSPHLNGGAPATATLDPVLAALHSYDHAPRPFVAQTRGMDRDLVPTRFLVGCGMDRKEAARRWEATWKWRRDFGADELLSCRFILGVRNPEGAIDDIKKYYLHGFHGRARATGKIVYYDRISPQAFSDLVALTPRPPGTSPKAFEQPSSQGFRNIVKYYVLITEFAYEFLEPDDPGGRGITVRIFLSLGLCLML